jgi:tetratricopeptide (TPR) repeat protein
LAKERHIAPQWQVDRVRPELGYSGKGGVLYAERLELLQSTTCCSEHFSFDPLSEDPSIPSAETAAAINRFKLDYESPDYEIGSWEMLESRASDVGWLTDQLLSAIDHSARPTLQDIPVRVTDKRNLAASCGSNHEASWITIDNGLIEYIEYVTRLLTIQIFRPLTSEYLIDPPSHETTLHLLRWAGQLFDRGQWPISARPISRMHFRHALNHNLARLRVGGSLFLIGHEFAHVIHGHAGSADHLLRNIERTVDELGYFLRDLRHPQEAKNILQGHEMEADDYAVDLALRVAIALEPEQEYRSQLEAGIFFPLIATSLGELVMLDQLQGDYGQFNRIYARSHSTAFVRLKRLLKRMHGEMTPLGVELVNTYWEQLQEVASELDHSSAEALPPRVPAPTVFQVRVDEEPHEFVVKNISEQQYLDRIQLLIKAGTYQDALSGLDEYPTVRRALECEAEGIAWAMGDGVAHLFQLRGAILSFLRNYAEAIYWYDKVLSSNSYDKACELWADKGICHYELRDYDKAMECAEKALAMNINEERGWTVLIRSLYYSSKHQAAFEAGHRAIEAIGGQPSLLLALASLSAEEHRFEDALALNFAALKKLPVDERCSALFNRGLYLNCLGRHQEAVEALRAALATCRDDNHAQNGSMKAEIWRQIGLSFQFSGDLAHPDAEEALKNVLRLRPGDEVASCLLARIDMDKGAFDVALKWIESALRICPELEGLAAMRAKILLHVASG